MLTFCPFTVDVTMTHQLASLAPRHGKAETIHHVVQTPLQLLQQHLAGDAFGAKGAFEVVAELAFLGEVDALRLLLLAKLQTVAHDLGLAILAVLAGREIALFDRTLVRKALCAFEEQLHALAAAKAAYCVFVPCQVTSPIRSELICSSIDRFTGLASLRPDPKSSCQGLGIRGLVN